MPPEETKVGVNGKRVKARDSNCNIYTTLQEERVQLLFTVTECCSQPVSGNTQLCQRTSKLATLKNPREVHKDLLETNPIILAGVFGHLKFYFFAKIIIIFFFFKSLEGSP